MINKSADCSSQAGQFLLIELLYKRKLASSSAYGTYLLIVHSKEEWDTHVRFQFKADTDAY